MHKKIPKICTGCRVSAAKIYLHHSTKIAKARPHRAKWQTDSSFQKQWIMDFVRHGSSKCKCVTFHSMMIRILYILGHSSMCSTMYVEAFALRNNVDRNNSSFFPKLWISFWIYIFSRVCFYFVFNRNRSKKNNETSHGFYQKTENK